MFVWFGLRSVRLGWDRFGSVVFVCVRLGSVAFDWVNLC